MDAMYLEIKWTRSVEATTRDIVNLGSRIVVVEVFVMVTITRYWTGVKKVRLILLKSTKMMAVLLCPQLSAVDTMAITARIIKLTVVVEVCAMGIASHL
jgi:hypothetical protein